jgi:uncharacterized protein (DUF934 family)
MLFELDGRAVDAAADLEVAADADVRGLDWAGARVIALLFAKFRDGRAYSSARILREAGFAGDLRAVGDLGVDQLLFLRRSGFSSVQPERAIDAQEAAAALGRYDFFYQRAADPAAPAWALRQVPAYAAAAE